MKKIVFAGGCFWCTEAVFKMLKGVTSVVSGYTGGDKPNPTYDEVCGGATSHAEVVEVHYDETQISLRDLLTVFFATHDPTTPNRQGADIGTQYRSAIFYTEADQVEIIDEFVEELNDSSEDGSPIVTEIKKLDRFYRAEDYHQDFYAKNTGSGYCELVINPKLARVQREFADMLKNK